MVQQTVQDRRGQYLVTKDLALVDKALVGGEDEAGLLIASLNETEQQTGTLPGQGQVAHLIEDEDFGIDPLLQLFLQAVLIPGPFQFAEQVVQSEEQDPVPGLHRLHAQGHGQVGFTHPRRSQQDDVLTPFHKGQARQGLD